MGVSQEYLVQYRCMLVHSRNYYLADAKIGPTLFIPQLPSSSLDINLGVVHKLHNHFREPPHPIILYSLYNICVYIIVIIWANLFPLAFVDFDIDKVCNLLVYYVLPSLYEQQNVEETM